MKYETLSNVYIAIKTMSIDYLFHKIERHL